MRIAEFTILINSDGDLAESTLEDICDKVNEGELAERIRLTIANWINLKSLPITFTVKE